MKKSFYLLAMNISCFYVQLSGSDFQLKAEDKDSSNILLTGARENTRQMIMNVPVHLTKADFLKLVMDYEKNPDTWIFQGEKPCLIDFYADWCAPCRITSPILEELAKEYAGKINIYKVDIEKEQELAAVFRVQSIPTFLFCPMDGISYHVLGYCQYSGGHKSNVY